ncbi:DUF262 domain-containing protein, partial [Oscillatoria amoena NRMC-F 0135]|nr:DUF262 domain-containing protein [Oscillatoria amoena NRMC-F 0135]
EKDAFRKIFNTNDRRKPINKALFEVWSVVLGKLTDEERIEVLNKKNVLVDLFIQLMNTDAKFVASITSTTGDKNRVIERHEKVYKLIKKTLQNDF